MVRRLYSVFECACSSSQDVRSLRTHSAAVKLYNSWLPTHQCHCLHVLRSTCCARCCHTHTHTHTHTQPRSPGVIDCVPRCTEQAARGGLSLYPCKLAPCHAHSETRRRVARAPSTTRTHQIARGDAETSPPPRTPGWHVRFLSPPTLYQKRRLVSGPTHRLTSAAETDCCRVAALPSSAFAQLDHEAHGAACCVMRVPVLDGPRQHLQRVSIPAPYHASVNWQWWSPETRSLRGLGS